MDQNIGAGKQKICAWFDEGTFVELGAKIKKNDRQDSLICGYGSMNGKLAYAFLQDGDIILADTAEDETVGKATEILNVDTATVISGLHTMACRPNYKFAPMYLGYYINSPTYHNQLLPFMQGIKVTSIGRKNISETSISFPCLEEQQKIADFLATYDEAISCAKQELDKWKELKKGLLQQMFA